MKVIPPGGSCATPAAHPTLILPTGDCFGKKQEQISTCPNFCGSQGLVRDASSTSFLDLIAFLLLSFSLHGNPPCSTPSYALPVCNIQLLHTLFDLWGFLFCLCFIVFSYGNSSFNTDNEPIMLPDEHLGGPFWVKITH